MLTNTMGNKMKAIHLASYLKPIKKEGITLSNEIPL